MSAIAGSTSDSEKSSNLRVASEAFPYSFKVTVIGVVLPIATASGSVVSVSGAVTAAMSL